MRGHIAFCCDDNYLVPACIMLESLMKTNKDIHFVAQCLAWWAGKPQGVKNMFDRHKEWVELEKSGS